MRDRKSFSLQRVRTVAAEAFAERGFDAVSVAEIAELAHCSTATIYEVYGSKAELFLDARALSLSQRQPPLPNLADADDPLDALLRYAVERIDYLLHQPTARYAQPPRNVDAQRVRTLTRTAIERHDPTSLVLAAVEQAVTAGTLRPGDPRAIAYLICAATGFEPVVHQLMFGAEAALAVEPIVRLVFTPLVTDAGGDRLDRFVRALDPPRAADARTRGGILAEA